MVEQLDCKIATKLMLEARERELSDTEHESLHFHVTRCMACGVTSAQLRFLKDALARYAEVDSPPA